MPRAKHIVMVFWLISCCISCEKTNNEFPLGINFTIQPTDPQTTDILKFEVRKDAESTQNQDLFYRWDWDGDSIWDTEFSSISSISKRFYQSGDHKVYLQYADGKGNTKTVTKTVQIAQGYSSPKPKFSVTPETGHFMTEFLFDAILTVDDEDSMSTLKFKWDFENDGTWDTQYLMEPIITHTFNKTGDFTVNLEVMDPGKRFGSYSRNVTVNRTDTCIIPKFTWWSQNGRVSDVFIFDASLSYHQCHPEKELIYKWEFPNQEYYDNVEGPIIEHLFKSSGEKKVLLKIEDKDGLENKLEQSLFVSGPNLPPIPKIMVPTPYGNTGTLFFMSTWESRDDHTPTSKLLYRWDFDGDGNFDTSQSNEVEVYHQYTTPDNYRCILEAIDEEGLVGKTSINILVSPYDYPTGFFVDKRDYKYYGTVKIGDNWWMSENLDYRMESKMGLPDVQKCYNDNPINCDKYGSLYALEFVIARNLLDDKICPKSWHIPTQSEMENLIDNIKYPNGMYNLIPGGGSGFNALFGGYIAYDRVWSEENQKYRYYMYPSGLGFSTYFLTTQIYPDRVFPKTYTLNIQNNYAELYPIETSYFGYYSIRCVKD